MPVENYIRKGREEYAELLRKYLFKRKMTQKELAKRLEISEDTLSRCLRNGNMNLNRMLTIQYILGIETNPQEKLLRQNEEINRKLDRLLEGR